MLVEGKFKADLEPSVSHGAEQVNGRSHGWHPDKDGTQTADGEKEFIRLTHDKCPAMESQTRRKRLFKYSEADRQSFLLYILSAALAS